MRRGTRVGQAYVALAVDGDGINEDIVHSVDEAGPGVERAGKDHGERYGEKFSDGFLDRLRDRFRKSKIGDNLSAHFARTGDESGALFLGHFTRFFNRSKAGQQIGNTLGSSLVTSMRARLAQLDTDIQHMMTQKVAPGSTAHFNALVKSLQDAQKEAGGLRRALSRLDVSGNGRGRDRGITGIDDFLLNSRFRNNAINILAKGMGGLVRLTEKVVLTGARMGTTFMEGFRGATAGASTLQRVMAGFSEVGAAGGGLFTKLAASGPGAVIAIAAVTVGLAVLASVIGALVGLVTALAATIAGALVGAILVLGGVLGTAAIAGGLVTAAFMSMTDAQKKYLSDAFKPLKEEMVGIGQIMLQEMVPAFSVWSKNLQIALMQLVPVAQVAGKAFADAGSILTASFSGPGFQQFSAALATYLPSIITKLSVALGGFLNGMLSIFSVLMPYVNQFAGYLARVANEFAGWAASAAGQNAIEGFVGRAVASLKSLWNFIQSFSGFIFKVLFSPEAMDAGNTIFDSMARTFDKFTEHIARAQADGSLKRWFDDAIKFGGQLWGVIVALYDVFVALYDSGVLNALGKALGFFAFQLQLAAAIAAPLISSFTAIGKGLDWLSTKFGNNANQINTASQGIFNAANTIWAASGIVTNAMHRINGASANALENPSSNPGRQPSFSMPSMGSLQQSGHNALMNTSVDAGGYKPPKQKKQYHNPYKKWALSLIKDGPSTSAQIKNAMLTLNKAAAKGIRAAAAASGKDDVRSALTDMIDSLHTGGAEAVNTARSALNTAANALASATSKGAAAAALRKVRRAQKDLRAALHDQRVLNAYAHSLAAQKVVKTANVNKLVAGLAATNVTLAEFATARAIVAEKLDAANQKLTDAISLRDDYKNQIEESVKSFASLASAQAQTIDGIEQALTSGDITGNLQTRLDQIKKFQNDLQLLLAQGLSDDAYKQIVDEGVVNGTVLADALLAGGSAAIQNTNSLVSQINGIAAQLGTETSNRLYQAGVDAAQGLVDGLTSLSAKLDAAAAKLGEAIAKSLAKALGIKSPSKVLYDMMDSVGDGAVGGLYNQHVKVGSAAAALASVIGVNPTDSRYTTTSEDAVSGNGNQRFRDLIVQTPTEDPKAVAMETLNEVVGRL